jgi:hypothetical protein
MTELSPAERLAAHGLRLSTAEVAKLAPALDDIARIAAWLGSDPCSYLVEPVTAFRAGRT